MDAIGKIDDGDFESADNNMIGAMGQSLDSPVNERNYHIGGPGLQGPSPNMPGNLHFGKGPGPIGAPSYHGPPPMVPPLGQMMNPMPSHSLNSGPLDFLNGPPINLAHSDIPSGLRMGSDGPPIMCDWDKKTKEMIEEYEMYRWQREDRFRARRARDRSSGEKERHNKLEQNELMIEKELRTELDIRLAERHKKFPPNQGGCGERLMNNINGGNGPRP